MQSILVFAFSFMAFSASAMVVESGGANAEFYYSSSIASPRVKLENSTHSQDIPCSWNAYAPDIYGSHALIECQGVVGHLEYWMYAEFEGPSPELARIWITADQNEIYFSGYEKLFNPFTEAAKFGVNDFGSASMSTALRIISQAAQEIVGREVKSTSLSREFGSLVLRPIESIQLIGKDDVITAQVKLRFNNGSALSENSENLGVVLNTRGMDRVKKQDMVKALELAISKYNAR